MVPPMGYRMYQFQQKLKSLKARICTWNREDFGNIFQEKKKLIEDIKLIHRRGMEEGWDDELREQEKDLMNHLEARERHEEIFWKKKSRNQWLQEGEKNTKFFHNSVIHNRHRSMIYKLRKTDGIQAKSRREIEDELIHRFEEIMMEDRGDRGQEIRRITRLILGLVTNEQNEMLVRPISMQDVEEAMNQMALGKEPRPYGFTTNFFHSFLDLIKQEVL